MALAAWERWSSGFVREASTGAIIATTSTAGAANSGGYLRDADGRIVIRPFTDADIVT